MLGSNHLTVEYECILSCDTMCCEGLDINTRSCLLTNLIWFLKEGTTPKVQGNGVVSAMTKGMNAKSERKPASLYSQRPPLHGGFMRQ